MNINEQINHTESRELIEEDISFKKEEQNNINLNTVNNNENEKVNSIIQNIDTTPKISELNIKDNEEKIDNEKNENEIKPVIVEDIENKKKLINELIEKEKLLEQLINSNNELKSKIEYSNKRFEEIVEKMNNQEKEKLNIETQIKNIDNDIKQYKEENINIIKQIEQLRNKNELKDKMEKEANVKLLLQNEQDKNKQLKYKLTNLKSINTTQNRYIEQLEKDNRIETKINELKAEIENEKKSLKMCRERYIKIDNFNIMMNNEIQKLKMTLKKMEEKPVEETKKIFTPDELNDTIGVISNLRIIINEKRNDLSNICRINDDKIYEILSQNKKVESEMNENIRMNKLLICKRNELKRIIKSILFCKK